MSRVVKNGRWFQRTDALRPAGMCLALGLALTGCAGQLGDAFERARSTLADAFEAPGTASQNQDPAAETAYREGLEARKRAAPDRGFRSFLEAAKLGHGAAAYEVSRAYAEGRGTARDLEAAAQWTNRAAAAGDPRAQFLVGSAYYGGIGVERDYNSAAAYLTRAARQGHAQAQYLLGEATSNGRGVKRDPAWAARWYGKAASQGMTEAQYVYGVAHAAGLGLPENPRTGYAWLHLAARAGHKEARSVKSAVAARLSPGQIEAAESWAARFRPARASRFADKPTVIYVQHALNRLGFDAGPADGIAGPRTRAAVERFQASTDLAADGRITPRLVGRLREG